MSYCGIAAALVVVTAPGIAAFAQTEVTISTAAPPATPRILGPTIIGATPGSPFLYTIAATGQAPLTFTATGLPSELSIAANSGTISGTTPAAGSYPISVTVTNSSGSATATLTLDAGPTLALTPPMGWNSYDSFGSSVTESEVLSAAQAVKTQLQPFGWNTVVIDYLWFDPEQVIDANGRFLPSPSKYPSATGNQGFKPLADQVHALGLSFGIHIMRGIPRKSVTANSPIANSIYTASQAGNTSDACPWNDAMWGVRGDTDAGKAWYDSIFAQYADWGVDFVKVDDMMNPYGGNAYHQTEVDAIRAAIDKTGRSIVLSLSPGPNQTRDVANLNANANMWRIVNDFWDTNGLSSLSDEFDAAYSWATTSGITQGHWPDADMLPLGYLGPRCPAHGSGPSGLSYNQQVTVMSLWGIMPSPLMFGGNPTQLEGDTWTVALLTNEEVLAVNQDAAGKRATRVAQQGSTEVWARDLSGGRKAVALFNRGTLDAAVSVTFAELGVSDTPTVRDLWHREDVTGMTTGISVNVPHEGALIYTLTPPGGAGGTGGAGGAGGSGGTAGASGTGGAGGSGGTGGAVGTATGGSTGSSGGAGIGGQPIGGSGASGGSGVTGGAAAPGGAGGTSAASGGASGSGDQGGEQNCNCRMAPHPATSGVGSAAWLALALFAWRRRRTRSGL
jgi:alpha-galactosidase